MRLSPLHDDFGAEVHGVDLREVSKEVGYEDIRAAFEKHSLLLFRDQNLDDDEHLTFARLFGPLEDRLPRPEPEITTVSNLSEEGAVIAEQDLRTLNLKANQLWHTDSTFLPVPALANVLQARIVPSSGGETDFVSTRVGWRKLPTALKEKARSAVLWHRYAHSRAQIHDNLARQELFTQWKDQAWRAVWPNPVNGKEALYIASHAFAVEGLPADEGRALIDRLIAAVTKESAIYRHHWSSGDVIVWDERATLHRGRPWPYSEARKLVSICVSAREDDGLELVKPH